MKTQEEAQGEEETFTAEVVNGGRVTIPKWVREKLSIKDGHIVDCEIKIKWRREKQIRK